MENMLFFAMLKKKLLLITSKLLLRINFDLISLIKTNKLKLNPTNKLIIYLLHISDLIHIFNTIFIYIYILYIHISDNYFLSNKQ